MNFLKDPYTQRLGKPRAMVHAELTKKDTITVPATVIWSDGEERANLFVAKADVEWALLPDKFVVVDDTGQVIKPSQGRQFYVTAETFNPWHGLMEADPASFR